MQMNRKICSANFNELVSMICTSNNISTPRNVIVVQKCTKDFWYSFKKHRENLKCFSIKKRADNTWRPELNVAYNYNYNSYNSYTYILL